MKWTWPWQKPATQDTAPRALVRGATVSISDPNVIELFGGGRSATGLVVTETTALTLSAVWRATSLIAGTIASLPLRTIEVSPDGERKQVQSWLDNPSGPGLLTPFEWMELVMFHQLLHGRAYLLRLWNNAGAQVGAWPIHPSRVGLTLDWDIAPVDGKVFNVTLDDGQTMVLTSREVQHLTAMSSDGRQGLSPLAIARESYGTSLAGDAAAASMFGNGALISAIVTSEEDVTEAEARKVKSDLMQQMTGTGNAGNIAVINRKLKVHPWSLSAADAQFLESRHFQIEEVARWFGVAPHLLMQTQKSTSFGTGIAEQNLALGRHTIMPWTVRLEQRLTRDLSGARRIAEFDFSQLERPSPKDEVALLVQQVSAGLMTVNEARAVRGLAGVGAVGDILRNPANTVPGASTNDNLDAEALAIGAGSDG